MGLKNNENASKRYFQILQLSGRSAKLHKCTSTKRREWWNLEAIGIKFHWKNYVKLCKLTYCNILLVVNFGRFIGKSLQQKCLFSKVPLSN